MEQIVREYAPWVLTGLLTCWALWLSVALTVRVAHRLGPYGRLREAWVNGRRADPPLVRVPRGAKHSRRQMACRVGGVILPSGKGVGWTDRSGRGWFAPDADYVAQHGYSFSYAMDPASLEGPHKGQRPSTSPPLTLAEIAARVSGKR